jgi:hypothetical protein
VQCFLLELVTDPLSHLVLGLDNADSARKLVRLLLADPLGPREDWENVLEGYESDPTRGLLIRYDLEIAALYNNTN